MPSVILEAGFMRSDDTRELHAGLRILDYGEKLLDESERVIFRHENWSAR
jgi:hypothetical protein